MFKKTFVKINSTDKDAVNINNQINKYNDMFYDYGMSPHLLIMDKDYKEKARKTTDRYTYLIKNSLKLKELLKDDLEFQILKKFSFKYERYDYIIFVNTELAEFMVKYIEVALKYNDVWLEFTRNYNYNLSLVEVLINNDLNLPREAKDTILSNIEKFYKIMISDDSPLSYEEKRQVNEQWSKIISLNFELFKPKQ
jgi:hypothetical protein